MKIKGMKSKKRITRAKSRKIATTSNQYERTFIISERDDSNGLIYTQLRKRLIGDFKLKESTDINSRPYFVWMEQLKNNKFDPKFYSIHCWIKNILSSEKSVITNKYELYKNFHSKYPDACKKYMAASWDFLKFQPLPDAASSVYIVRPVGVGAFAGKDVIIVHDQKSWNNARTMAKKYSSVIASEYIVTPMLFEGRKFHIRVYLIAAKINGIYRSGVFKFYEIFTAADKYVNGDYNNSRIHDTHFKSTPHDYICPDVLSSSQRLAIHDKVFPLIKDCMINYVSKILEEVCKPYPESKNAFEVFGCDFMVRDNGTPVLLEVNDRIGFSFKIHEKKMEFCKKYFNEVCDFLKDYDM